MSKRKKIHIISRSDATEGARVVYDHLWDDGSPVFRFDSGFGFVSVETVKARDLLIVPGWAS